MEWIPTPLMTMGPGGLAYWQWLGLAVALFAALVGGRIAAWLVQWAGRRMTGRTETTLDDELMDRLAGPLRLVGFVGCARLALPLLQLPPAIDRPVVEGLLALLAVAIVWGVLRAIDLISHHLLGMSWAQQRPSSRALLSLFGRAAKVVVVIIAVLSFLGTLGLPVSSLLAGLGIGGIALAFGAQKTVENLFGAVAIGVDQPLREGDFVLIEGNTLGTVETVGLRSTRIRTLDRTVVTLPNGRLADLRIETFAARDRCRMAATFGLVYETTSEQLREVIAGFERVLLEHPKIWPDVAVRFIAFGESSLDVEVMAWFQTSDYAEFCRCRQTVLLGFMEVVEQAGSSFAFPTRTIHMAGQPVAAAPVPAR